MLGVTPFIFWETHLVNSAGTNFWSPIVIMKIGLIFTQKEMIMKEILKKKIFQMFSLFFKSFVAKSRKMRIVCDPILIKYSRRVNMNKLGLH